MLDGTMQALKAGRIVLASQSPRRHEIIKRLGINAEIVPSLYDESLDRATCKNHGEYVKELARCKVQEVYDRLKQDAVAPSLVIGADTIVTMDDIIYGKPKDEDDAFKMLSRLANREHTVYTGMCLKMQDKEISFYDTTIVKIGDISEAQIRAYIKTGEPLDKAGAYGAQGIGGCLIEKIEGDFYTIVGIPLYQMVKRLNDLYCKV